MENIILNEAGGASTIAKSGTKQIVVSVYMASHEGQSCAKLHHLELQGYARKQLPAHQAAALMLTALSAAY